MTEQIDSAFNKHKRAILYFEKERKYLETSYFQILRNSKADYFDKNSLIIFTCISEYLNSKIFSVLAKENKHHLNFDEFASGISLIFSLYFPLNSKLLKSVIFNLISDKSDSITYKNIREFTNNLLFDCMCKASNYNFDFFINLTSKLSLMIKKTFGIGTFNTKLTQFTQKDFFHLTGKHPAFLNTIILLLNLLSPINEKLIKKFVDQADFEIYENDDFEDELELEYEKTPRVNSLPISHNISAVDSSKSFPQQNFKFNKKINHCSNNNLNSNFNEDNKIYSTSNRYLSKNYDGNEVSSFMNKSANSDCSPKELECEEESNKSMFNKINNLGNNQTFLKKDFYFQQKGFLSNLNNNDDYNNNDKYDRANKKRFSKFKKNLEISQAELSTDNSDNLCASKNQDKSFDLKINKKFSPIKSYDYLFNGCNYISEDFLYSKNDLNKFNIKIQIKSETSLDQNINKSLIAHRNQEANSVENEYFHHNLKSEFTSNPNYTSFAKDLSLLNCIHHGSELYEGLKALYNEVKHSSAKINLKLKALLRRKRDNNNNLNVKDETANLNEKCINLNQNTDEKIFPFKIKYIGDDLVIYNSNPFEWIKNAKKNASIINRQIEEFLLNKLSKKQNAKYSVHFYSLKNLILPSYPNQSDNQIDLILNGTKTKYYRIDFFHIDQEYELLFEEFEELETFYRILYKKLKTVERLFFYNNSKKKDNYHLIQRIDIFKKPQDKFSVLHELIDNKYNKSIKIQTLNKSHLNIDNFQFLKKLYDTCKLNNFLTKNILPVESIYSNHFFVILEYASDYYRIKYEREKNNYSVIVNYLDSHLDLKEEVLKFKQLVKLLNKYQEIAYLFQLFESERVLIYSGN